MNQAETSLPIGVLAAAGPSSLSGWLAVQGATGVEIRIDGRLMRTVRAVHDATGVSTFEYRFAPVTFDRFPAEFELSVRELGTGRELSGSPVRLAGNPQNPPGTALQNGLGEPYTLNKNGGLSIRFSDRTPESRLCSLRSAAHVIDVLAQLGYSACIAYGTLLGATRDGALIGHDDDIDLMVVVHATNLTDARDEFIKLWDALGATGVRVRPFSAGQAHLFTTLDGETRATDVFLSWFDENDGLFLNFAIAGTLNRDVVQPFRPVIVEGVPLPGPADPAAMCLALYGENWRTPDPHFNWRPLAAFDQLAIPLKRAGTARQNAPPQFGRTGHRR